MTQPRQILPGTTYIVTRRTLGRFHLFAPHPRMRDIFLYTLAVAAARTGVLVHVAVLMSTHPHLVVTDVEGRMPEFLHYFHRHMALATKALRDWEGAVWDKEQASLVELCTPQAVIEQCGYAIANPTIAGLVAYANDWPGVNTRPSEIGKAVWRVERPREYFTPNDQKWPPVVELRLVMPSAARELGVTDDELRELVAESAAQREKAARAELKEKGWKFLGADRCAKLSPFGRARSREPIRKRNPTFAVGGGNAEAYRQAVERLRAFRLAYRERLESWRAGLRDAPFPPGTWLMRHRHGAVVEEPTTIAA